MRQKSQDLVQHLKHEPAQGARILVVDDHEDVRWSLKRLLEDSGFVLSEATNGGDALDLLTSAPEPALMILDVEMPVMSGTALLRIMSRYERLSRLPVLVLSGGLKSGFPAGCNVVGVVSKPCDVEELVRKVKHYAAARAR